MLAPARATSRTSPRSRTRRCRYASIGGLGGARPRSTTSSTCSRRCWRTRAYGDFWSYMLRGRGWRRHRREPELELHDMAALVGHRRRGGRKLHRASTGPGPDGGNALATNGRLTSRCWPSSGTARDSGRGRRPPAGGQVHDLSARRQRMAPRAGVSRGPTTLSAAHARQDRRRQQQRRQVEPAVAARRARRRVADRRRVRSGRAAATPRCRDTCPAAPGSSPRGPRRRRAARRPRSQEPARQRNQNAPSTSGRRASDAPYGAQQPRRRHRHGSADPRVSERRGRPIASAAR